MLAAVVPEWLEPANLIQNGGLVLLFLIVFAESGLLIGFFLPGDSLLFTAGAVASGAFAEAPGMQDVQFNIWVLMIGCFLAAVAGDQVGYMIGRKAGPRLFNRPDSKFFKREYVDKGTEFFDEHGGRAIILARFVPIVRTFVPTIAGVSQMPYSSFVRYNVIGGFLWGVGITFLGYQFGKIDFVKENLEVAILGVVFISLLPIALEVLKARKAKAARETESV